MTDDELVSPFRPRARILQLLGDQLIGSPRLAVLELVKNAYDADASSVTIVLKGLDSPSTAQIVITDDGSGMNLEIIRDIWLVPGHDHRGEQRAALQRTARGRLPLGEKGLGRFAVHKLGDEIELVTRSSGSAECYLEINWTDLTDEEFLEDADVTVRTRNPQVFQDDHTGTQITIGNLRGDPWTRGQVRWLQRQIMSISSPFADKVEDFHTELVVEGHDDWLSGVQDPEAMLRLAPWKFDFEIDDGRLSANYAFRGVAGMGAASRSVVFDRQPLATYFPPADGSGKPLSQNGIGPIKGSLYVFDRDATVLKHLGEASLIRRYLNEAGGVRVYRDGIRVYNYGEPGDDWLGLDLRRVNAPTERLSNNIILGAIELDLEYSDALHEKTNREGFIENRAYAALQELVLEAIAIFEVERNLDKRELRDDREHDARRSQGDLSAPLARIQAIAKAQGISNEVDPLIADTLARFDRFKATMLRSNLSGMALVVVFHELEQGIRQLVRDGEEGADPRTIAEQARIISRLLDGFGDIVRQGETKENSIRNLLERVVALNSVRISHHNVEVISPLIQGTQDDARMTFSFGLLLGALNNLVDNSFYWLGQRSRTDTEHHSQIYLGYDPLFFEGPAIVIADNGPGFIDDPIDLTDAFFTRRPNGMGVGLYYVNLAAELSGGRLSFPAPDQVNVPSAVDGAIVAFVLSPK